MSGIMTAKTHQREEIKILIFPVGFIGFLGVWIEFKVPCCLCSRGLLSCVCGRQDNFNSFMKKAIGLLMQKTFCGRRGRNLVGKFRALIFWHNLRYFFREGNFFDKLDGACRGCYCTAVDTIIICADVITQRQTWRQSLKAHVAWH